MNEHPQRYILPIVLPKGFDDPRSFILDISENRHMDLPEISKALYAAGSAKSQEVQIGHGLEVPLHVRYDHISKRTRIVAMKDLISLLFPCDDLVDPPGSGGREGCDERFHDTFVELRRLLDENDILLGILEISIIDDISKQTALQDTKVQTLRM